MDTCLQNWAVLLTANTIFMTPSAMESVDHKGRVNAFDPVVIYRSVQAPFAPISDYGILVVAYWLWHISCGILVVAYCLWHIGYGILVMAY